MYNPIPTNTHGRDPCRHEYATRLLVPARAKIAFSSCDWVDGERIAMMVEQRKIPPRQRQSLRSIGRGRSSIGSVLTAKRAMLRRCCRTQPCAAGGHRPQFGRLRAGPRSPPPRNALRGSSRKATPIGLPLQPWCCRPIPSRPISARSRRGRPRCARARDAVDCLSTERKPRQQCDTVTLAGPRTASALRALTL